MVVAAFALPWLFTVGAGTASADDPPPIVPPFQFTNQPQSIKVPGGIAAMYVQLDGGSGGNSSGPGPVSRGGYGAALSGTVPVMPNQQVDVTVGGQGGHFGTNPGNSHGGWGGNSSGGAGGVDNSGSGAGGGGGATTLSLAGQVLAVAGGGGGGGTAGMPLHGGDGGAAGDPAHDGNKGSGTGACGPGDGGQAAVETTGNGAPGGIGGGGTDGTGGGGGGGVKGGGGGHGGCASGGGGGAGSSMLSSSVLNGSISAGSALGDGLVTITWIADSEWNTTHSGGTVVGQNSGASGAADHPAADTVVAKGDTLSQLAADHQVTGGAQALYEANKAVLSDPDTLIAGQQLRIDNGVTPPAEVTQVTLAGDGQTFAQRSVSHLNGLNLVVHNSPTGLALSSYDDSSSSAHVINESNQTITVTVTQNGAPTTTNIAAGQTTTLP